MSEELTESETIGGNPKTVIVTTETGGEIRFRADEWDAEGQLDVLTGTRQRVASFAAGRWTSVRLDGVITPDRQAEALGVARRALAEAWRALCDIHAEEGGVGKIVNDALGGLFDLGYE
jgi:hypothetical protein